MTSSRTRSHLRRAACEACNQPSWKEAFDAADRARRGDAVGALRWDLLTTAVGERSTRHHHLLRRAVVPSLG